MQGGSTLHFQDVRLWLNSELQYARRLCGISFTVSTSDGGRCCTSLVNRARKSCKGPTKSNHAGGGAD